MTTKIGWTRERRVHLQYQPETKGIYLPLLETLDQVPISPGLEWLGVWSRSSIHKGRASTETWWRPQTEQAWTKRLFQNQNWKDESCMHQRLSLSVEFCDLTERGSAWSHSMSITLWNVVMSMTTRVSKKREQLCLLGWWSYLLHVSSMFRLISSWSLVLGGSQVTWCVRTEPAV